MKIAAAVLIATAGVFASQAAFAASQAASSLGACLYRSATPAQKDVFIQWAYVTIGGFAAAKRIQPIPEAATRQVTQRTKSALAALLLRSCPGETAAAFAADPRNAAADAMEEFVSLMMREKVRSKMSELLNRPGRGRGLLP